MTREERENAIRCLKLWIEREPYIQTYKTCLEALEQEPCEDAISRQAVIKAVDKLTLDGSEIVLDEDITVILEEVPSVAISSAEPKTGHWIDNHNGTISCSHCHTWFYKDDRYFYMRHCPYCGARMLEPQERSE